MKRPGRLDWFVYRLFYRRWNPILAARPDLVAVMRRSFDDWLHRWEDAR